MLGNKRSNIMKTKNLFFTSILIGYFLLTSGDSSLFGQFFSQYYLNGGFETADWGEVTICNSQYVVSGRSINSYNSWNGVAAMVAVSLPDGTHPSSFEFKEVYVIKEPTNLLPSQIGSCFVSKKCDYQFGAIGVYGENFNTNDPNNNNKIYYSELDLNGTSNFTNSFASSDHNQIIINSITQTQDSLNYLFFGSAYNRSTSIREILVGSIEISSGNLDWAKTYSFSSYDSEATDGGTISPYDPTIISVVGNVNISGKKDGIIFTLDLATGSLVWPISVPVLCGTSTSNDEFWSVIWSGNMAVGSGGGYVITGFSDQNTDNDIWVIGGDEKMDASSVLSYLYDFNNNGQDNKGYDVLERKYGTNQELYVGGRLQQTWVYDYEFIKLDFGLNSLSHFLYGNSGTEFFVQLGLDEGIGSTSSYDIGLISFGTVDDITSRGAAITKLYYNGYGACNNTIGTSTRTAGPGVRDADPFEEIGELIFSTQPDFFSIGTLSNVSICNGTNLNGSNAKVSISSEEDIDNLKPSIEVNDDFINLNLEASGNYGESVVSLINLWGQRLYNHRLMENEVEVSIPVSGFAPGIYLLELTNSHRKVSYKIFKE